MRHGWTPISLPFLIYEKPCLCGSSPIKHTQIHFSFYVQYIKGFTSRTPKLFFWNRIRAFSLSSFLSWTERGLPRTYTCSKYCRLYWIGVGGEWEWEWSRPGSSPRHTHTHTHTQATAHGFQNERAPSQGTIFSDWSRIPKHLFLPERDTIRTCTHTSTTRYGTW